MCSSGMGVRQKDGSVQRGVFGKLFNTPESRLKIIGDLSEKQSTPTESTPPIPQGNNDSGLSIRRSNSGSSSNTSNRRGGSRSGARKRYKTT